MRKLTPVVCLILLLLAGSCSTTKRSARGRTPSAPAPDHAMEYLNKYGALAINEMKRSGVPASITLAQGMVESDYGRSRLATKANNHFGIKCHSDWKGNRIYHDDNKRGECFRAYRSVEESFRDHSDFLVKGTRYRDLFALRPDDYKGWSHGLRKAGYATEPRYPEMLIRKIEEYRLWVYDSGVIPVASKEQLPSISASRANRAAISVPAEEVRSGQAVQVPKEGVQAEAAGSEAVMPRADSEPITVISLNRGARVQKNNNVDFIIAEKGDTWESLANRHQLLVWELFRFNDLAMESSLTPGAVIYIQPKRAKASQGLMVHTVQPGETMHSVSQKYAMRLTALYKLNLMDEGTECRPGQKLRIR